MEFNGNKSIYLQICDAICERILSGELGPDMRIPSVREYGAEIGVNPNTVMRSYEKLTSDGIIYNRRGIGYFISQDAKEIVLQTMKKDFLEYKHYLCENPNLLDSKLSLLKKHLNKDNMENTNIKEIQIFLNLQGDPIEGHISLRSTGHGHYAYVEQGVDSFVRKLFKEMSIWNGSTDTHTTRDGRYFSQFELDCADKKFFKSRSFKKICEHHNVKFIIMDNYDDNQIFRDFWDQMKR